MTMTSARKSSKRRGVSALASVGLFKELPASVVRELDEASRVEEVPAGHVFFNPGETGFGLFVLEKGAVQLFRTLGTRKLLIQDLKPPGVFGEMGCVGTRQYHCTGQAQQPSRVRTIKRGELETILKNFPEVTRRLLDLVSQRFFRVLMDLEATSFRGLIARTAQLLLESSDGDRVQNMTHKKIAEQLHVYRESATEVLGELRKAGIIAVGRKQIRILHRGRLERASRE